MNQILETKLIKNKSKIIKILKFQLFMSFLGIFYIIFFINNNEQQNITNHKISNILSLNATLNSIYKTENLEYSNILGTLEIPKIGLNYPIFSEFNEELLKLSPCKFYGPNLNEIGNIAIVGHNYNNHTFFSDLNKLENEDEIYLYSNDNIKNIYSIYETYETTDDDLSCLNTKLLNSKELTLVTCNNYNKKRFIVKSVFKNSQ